MSAVEAQPLVGQRRGEPLARPPHGRRVGGRPAPGSPTSPPSVAERGGEQHDRSELGEDEELRSQEQSESDADGNGRDGGEPRHPGAVTLGWRCGTGDLDDLLWPWWAEAWGRSHVRRLRRPRRGRAAVAAQPQGRRAHHHDGRGVHRRRPVDRGPVDQDPVRGAEVPRRPRTRRRGRPRGRATGHRRAAPARMAVPRRPPARAGERVGSTGIRTADDRDVQHARSRPGGGAMPADGDRCAVDEGRAAEHGIRRDVTAPGGQVLDRLAEVLRPARRRGRRAVCRPDQRDADVHRPRPAAAGARSASLHGRHGRNAHRRREGVIHRRTPWGSALGLTQEGMQPRSPPPRSGCPQPAPAVA